MKSRRQWPEKLVDSICETIATRREELGMTIYALSQTSGVSQQAISYYEKRQRQPSLECLAKVSRALEWELSELIAEAERRLD